MVSTRLYVVLAACLAVAGCVGGHRSSSAPPVTPTQVAVSAKPVLSSPTREPVSPASLLKAAGGAPVAGTPQSPLSCVDQHLKDIQAGKILSNGACQ